MKTIERILVAVDPSTANRSVLFDAARLAVRLGVQLKSLFVEDANLIRLAQLPMAREIVYGAGQRFPMSVGKMERSLHLQGLRLHDAIMALEHEHNMTISFDVIRGDIASEICNAANETDLLVFGRSNFTFPGGSRIGATARTILARATCNLLILHPGTGSAHSACVFYTGSDTEDYILSLTLRLAEQPSACISVIIPQQDKYITNKLLEQLNTIGNTLQVRFPVLILEQNTMASLARMLNTTGCDVFALDSQQNIFSRDDILALILQTRLPVILMH